MKYCFVGPTLSNIDLQQYSSFQFLPPVKAGDINTLIQSSDFAIDSIIIVDGLYHSKLSIRHKEILAAMRRGIRVYGVGSLGALRAAELDKTGMIGFGCVFSYFRSTVISADDEVSVVHEMDPPYNCSTLPLINVRLTSQDWVKEGFISADQANEILRFYKNLHYTERSEKVLSNFLSSQDISPSLVKSIVDFKKRDTLTLLGGFDESLANDLSYQVEDFPTGYYFSNYFIDQSFPSFSNTSTQQKPIWNFGDSIDEMNLHTLTYNSFNRHASVLLATSMGISVTDVQVEVMKEFLDATRTIASNSYSDYKSLLHDPLFLVTLAKEEAILFKLHQSLSQTLGISGVSRLRHYWLSVFQQSSFLDTAATLNQGEFDSCLRKLFEGFNTTSSPQGPDNAQ